MSNSLSEVLPPEEMLLTPSEAARILGVTPEAVRSLNNKGKLPALKTMNGRRLFLLSQVNRLAEQRSASALRPRKASGLKERR
jgi:excisionase family DNA binding protein